MASVTTVTTATASPDNSPALVLWINRALEALWLLTVVLVPLVFVNRGYMISEANIDYLELPKIALLRTLVGLMTILWLLEWGIRGRVSLGGLLGGDGRGFQVPPVSLGLARLGRWIGEQPTRWLILAVWLYLGTVVLSTVFSASFAVSMWGDVPGQDGYSTYTIVAYVLLFAVVATHLKTRSQMWRLLGAIVLMGTVVGGYAVLQHYGLDFLELKAPLDQPRASSTVGNPILAAAVMLMTIPITLLVATISLQAPIKSARFWGKAGLWAVVLAVQVLGIIFTSSRGPSLGAILALAVFLALTGVFVSRRALVRASVMLALCAALTWVIISINIPTLVSTNSTQAFSRVNVARLASTGSAIVGGGLSGRVEYWVGSWRLMAHHPWFGFDSLSLPWLRPLIGYGPELFRSTYLLESLPTGPRLLLPEPRQAHNYFVHQGVELGFLGLLTSIGVFGALFLVGGYQLLWQRHRYTTAHQLVLLCLIATLVGRLLEQMVGVARVSDLTLVWVLLAVFVGLPKALESPAASHPSPTPASGMRPRRRSQGRPTGQAPYSDWQLLGRLAVVTFLIAGIGTLTWVKSLSYPLAAVQVAKAAESRGSEDLLTRLTNLNRAIDLAPDVLVYYYYRANLLWNLRREDQEKGVVPSTRNECFLPTEESYQECLARQIYQNGLQVVEQRPYNYLSRLLLAQSELALASLTGDTVLEGTGVRRFQEVAEMMPQSWPARRLAAEVLLRTGQPAASLRYLEEFQAENKVRPSEYAFLRGKAYRDLGELEQAVQLLERSLDYGPLVDAAEAHQILAELYSTLGRSKLAAEHQRQSDDLGRP